MYKINTTINGYHAMKITDIFETTTSGSVATVAKPLGKAQSRTGVGKGIYPGVKGGNLLTGKPSNKKFANSVKESKQIEEAHLEEDDLIIVPGQGRSRKNGLIKHGESRLDHEVEMAKSDLFSAAKNAKKVYEMIQDVSEEEGLDGWVQEKIIKANDYLNTVREYLEGKRLQEMTRGGVAPRQQGSQMPVTKEYWQKAVLARYPNARFVHEKMIDGAIYAMDNSGQVGSYEPKRSYAKVGPESLKTESIAEGSQRGDTLVTDSLKIMRGSEVSDAIKALKTVLGDREYNSRRGFYNFYVKQIVDMYGQQGVAEAKADSTGSWVVYNGSKLTKFKTYQGAKAYAEKNGGTVASSEYYYDKIQNQGKEPTVNEASNQTPTHRSMRDMSNGKMSLPSGSEFRQVEGSDKLFVHLVDGSPKEIYRINMKMLEPLNNRNTKG